jgi:DNA-binding IclR family transcriptional regulator
MSPNKKKYYQITSLEKGIKVIELLADKKALTVSAVAEQLGFNRAGSHRFLATLRDLGYVEKDENNRYRLTFKVVDLGMMVLNRFEIRQEARPFMQELSTKLKETVNLGFWNGQGIFHLDKIDSMEILRIDAPLGSYVPAYCTALGKAILAQLPKEELNNYLLGIKLVKHGPNTIISKRKLQQELQSTRMRGYAIDNEELARGLRCVAAPVFDYTGRAVYALSVSAPVMRFSLKTIEQAQRKIRDVCGRLSLRLGHT